MDLLNSAGWRYIVCRLFGHDLRRGPLDPPWPKVCARCDTKVWGR